MPGSGFVFDERFLGHDTGVQTSVTMRGGSFTLAPEPHPSAIFITQRIKQFLDGAGLTANMQAIAAREPLLDVDLGISDLYAGSSELDRSQTIFSNETRYALLTARNWHKNWWNI